MKLPPFLHLGSSNASGPSGESSRQFAAWLDDLRRRFASVNLDPLFVYQPETRCVLRFGGLACGYRGTEFDDCDKTIAACRARGCVSNFAGSPAMLPSPEMSMTVTEKEQLDAFVATRGLGPVANPEPPAPPKRGRFESISEDLEREPPA